MNKFGIWQFLETTRTAFCQTLAPAVSLGSGEVLARFLMLQFVPEDHWIAVFFTL